MDTFSALADSTRRNIIEMLYARGQLSATDISDKFKVSPPAISQHLKVLREAKWVQVEKRAQQRIYKINPSAINEIDQWIKKMTQRMNERFEALDAVLKTEKRKMFKKR